jgi:hypothetical protein
MSFDKGHQELGGRILWPTFPAELLKHCIASGQWSNHLSQPHERLGCNKFINFGANQYKLSAN